MYAQTVRLQWPPAALPLSVVHFTVTLIITRRQLTVETVNTMTVWWSPVISASDKHFNSECCVLIFMPRVYVTQISCWQCNHGLESCTISIFLYVIQPDTLMRVEPWWNIRHFVCLAREPEGYRVVEHAGCCMDWISFMYQYPADQTEVLSRAMVAFN